MSEPQTIEAHGVRTIQLDELLPGDVIRIVEIGNSEMAEVMNVEHLSGARRVLHVREATHGKDRYQHHRKAKVWLWSYSRIEVIALVERPEALPVAVAEQQEQTY